MGYKLQMEKNMNNKICSWNDSPHTSPADLILMFNAVKNIVEKLVSYNETQMIFFFQKVFVFTPNFSFERNYSWDYPTLFM